MQVASAANDKPFLRPRWDAPLDVAYALAKTPATATVKGMFLQSVRERLADTGDAGPIERYIAFKDYPVRDFMQLCVACSEGIYPTLPLRQGLRCLRQDVFETLLDTLVGRVIFGVAGRSWAAALNLTSKGYNVSFGQGRAEVTSLGERSAIVALRRIYNFPESYQVGVLEGAMRYYGIAGQIRLRSWAWGDTDILLEWV